MRVDPEFTERDCRTLVFRLVDETGDPSYADVVGAIEFDVGEMPSSMIRRVYSDVSCGLTMETDLEYLSRIGSFPPASYRQDQDTHAAAAACARAAWRLADTAVVVEHVYRRGREVGLVDVHPVGAVTAGLRGEPLRCGCSPTTGCACTTPC